MISTTNFQALTQELERNNTSLVAVSKHRTTEELSKLYEMGQRDFGENRVQELTDKWKNLPKDISWHMIGHLQVNKVKKIIPFVSLIHSVDSLKLLETINKEASKYNRSLPCLLQIHIAREENKFGLSAREVLDIINSEVLGQMHNIDIRGLMGMGSFTDDQSILKNEFKSLQTLFTKIRQDHSSKLRSFNILSMGMSGDYKVAMACGSTMVRIGSTLFN